jgi:NADPH:quinone reductase-like Zn-dependent oxidoreductase
MSSGQEMMRAVVQRRYGADPEKVLRIERVPKPVIKDDEVLIRVRAAGVDAGTRLLMTGVPYLMRIAGFGLRGPKAQVPGWAVAGTVEAIGDAVTGLAPGDEVFGTCRGSFAEYAVTRPGRLAPKPASMTFEQAAALPNSATTALQAVRDRAKVRPGQQVLVIGASGGVGSYAVQIAKSLGAEVTGTCRPSKADLVRAIGADHVLDYTSADITAGQQRYDVIIDIAGDRPMARMRRILAPTGTLVITGGTGSALFGGTTRHLRVLLFSAIVGQKVTSFIALERQADLNDIRNLVSSTALSSAIDKAYPLAEAATAIRRLIDGQVRGKVVLSVDPGAL